jgi:hypothetical protein
LDKPLLGGSQVSKARPGAPTFFFPEVFPDVQNRGFRTGVQNRGFRTEGSEQRVQNRGFRTEGSEQRVQNRGFRTEGSEQNVLTLPSDSALG